jgi:hypothetical protein
MRALQLLSLARHLDVSSFKALARTNNSHMVIGTEEMQIMLQSQCHAQAIIARVLASSQHQSEYTPSVGEHEWNIIKVTWRAIHSRVRRRKTDEHELAYFTLHFTQHLRHQSVSLLRSLM